MAVSVSDAIGRVLETAGPRAKPMAARALARDWRAGRLAHVFDCAMPDRPARPDRPRLLAPAAMPKRGRGQSDGNRIALLHALAHIEFSAIDLALDMAGRFGNSLPPAFVSDWLGVAADEAMHFALLDRRLKALGSHYGALPAHEGLWEAAESTADDVLARLAIVPMVLEARGLDVSPATIRSLRKAGDSRSAAILERIYRDEIRHVSVGTRWFAALCDRAGLDSPAHWKKLVSQRFRGALKPPFNDSARDSAGLTREYYGQG